MDVVTPEHAKIAENAGACAVMALERVPSDIRADGGVARMSDPGMVLSIMEAVTIPVMAKCRIGHFAEARILEPSASTTSRVRVLTPADESHHVWKHDFKVPFVCGCRDLGEALRIGEARRDPHQGRAGTGNVVEAVRHIRAVTDHIRKVQNMPTMSCPPRRKTSARRWTWLSRSSGWGGCRGQLCRRRRRYAADAALMMWLGVTASLSGPASSSRKTRRGGRSPWCSGDPLPGLGRGGGGLQGPRRPHARHRRENAQTGGAAGCPRLVTPRSAAAQYKLPEEGIWRYTEALLHTPVSWNRDGLTPSGRLPTSAQASSRCRATSWSTSSPCATWVRSPWRCGCRTT